MEGRPTQRKRRAKRAIVGGNRYGLSPRELTVLKLVTEGKSDKEIALALGLQTTTVSKHVANVRRKMAAPSRVEAGVRAWREGLVGGR